MIRDCHQQIGRGETKVEEHLSLYLSHFLKISLSDIIIVGLNFPQSWDLDERLDPGPLKISLLLFPDAEVLNIRKISLGESGVLHLL